MSANVALHCGIVIPLALMIAGCTGAPVDSPKSLANRGVPELIDHAPLAEESPQPSSQGAADLASLAQRDVDDFMRLKREAQTGTANPQDGAALRDPQEPGTVSSQTTTETGAHAAAPAEDAPVASPIIIWTDPVGRADADDESSEVEASGTAASSVTTAMDGNAGVDGTSSPNSVLASPDPTLAGMPSSDRMQELLVGLSAELYMRASDADQPLRELIMISATSMVDPSRQLANIDALPGLTEREREMLGAFQNFFLELGKQLDGSKEADSAITSALRELQSTLSKAPALKVPAAALCTSVEGFGKYQPFSQNTFLAHSGQQMVVYVEIDDFNSTQNSVGQWVTELAQQLIIYSDRDGIPVWREEWLPVVDTSLKPRQDFYTTQLVTLPDALSVGRYQLKIRLRDEHTGAEAEHSIPFEMVADSKLATQR